MNHMTTMFVCTIDEQGLEGGEVIRIQSRGLGCIQRI